MSQVYQYPRPADFSQIRIQYISKNLIMQAYQLYVVSTEDLPRLFSMLYGSATTIGQPVAINSVSQPAQVELPKQKILDINLEDLEQAGYQVKKKVWSQAEDANLLFFRDTLKLDWIQIAQKLEGRNSKMCYSRYRRLQSRTKIVWTEAQDKQLCEMVQKYGENWEYIAQYFQKRNIKQVRERYINYLHPSINKDRWTIEQDFKLVNLINKYGLEWKDIEQHFEGRTQNQLKNRYFGRLKRISDKKVQKKAIQAKGVQQCQENLG